MNSQDSGKKVNQLDELYQESKHLKYYYNI